MANEGKYLKYEEVLEDFYEKFQGKRKVIETELIQAPDKENNNVAICAARVEVRDRDTGDLTHGPFTGIGDASDASIPNQGVRVHKIRVAETRAKARALKDATNIKGTFADDPDPEDVAPHPDQVPGIQRGGASRLQQGQREAAEASNGSEQQSESQAATELRELALQWAPNGIVRIETSARKQISEMTAQEIRNWTQRIETYLSASKNTQEQAAVPAQGGEEAQDSLEPPPF